MLAVRESRVADAAKLFGMTVLGSLFSFSMYYTWNLELRWFVVVVAAIVMLSVSMCFVQVFSDFVLAVLFLSLPAMSFNKWFWPSGYAEAELGNLVYGGMLGLGLIDFLLVGLYLGWLYRLFVERSEPLPVPNFIDLVVLLFLGLHVLSSLGADDPQLGFYATEYLAKYSLLYFYLSRNLRPAHLPWLLAGLCWTVLVQAGLGAYQHLTGNLLGIALDKGAGGSALNYQYIVPGLESKTRATGTFYDSHALGDFMAMVIPFFFVAYLTPRMRGWSRFLFLVATILASLTLVLSFSRSAWLGGAITLAFGIILILTVWRESQVIFPLTVVATLVLATLPWSASYIYDRFENSPIETLTTRFNQYRVALDILESHPIFGIGPGNYYEALKRYDTLWLEALPVHNVALWIATETGLLGLFCYLTIVFSALKRFWCAFSKRRDLAGRLAMAGFIALIAHLLDGLTDPLFREPSVFTLFWMVMALAVALPNFPKQRSPASKEPAPA